MPGLSSTELDALRILGITALAQSVFKSEYYTVVTFYFYIISSSSFPKHVGFPGFSLVSPDVAVCPVVMETVQLLTRQSCICQPIKRVVLFKAVYV